MRHKLFVVVVLPLLLSGCGIVRATSNNALCDSLAPLVDNHVDALIEDGGQKSLVTGQILVAGFDGGCTE